MIDRLHPLGLGRLLRVGARDVSQYTGMVLALFLVQAIVAMGAALVVAMVLMQAFAGRPVFDEAVDGDLVAWLEVLRDHRAVFQAVGGVAIGAVLTVRRPRGSAAMPTSASIRLTAST